METYHEIEVISRPRGWIALAAAGGLILWLALFVVVRWMLMLLG